MEMEYEFKQLEKYLVKDQISLTQKEQEIFQIFMDVIKENHLKTIIRVAGGWVRDKLLGKESIDLDLAIDDMTGEEFIKQTIDSIKKRTEVHGFGVTRLNPDKSKHLETATLQIKGIWLDIVNLRGEISEQNNHNAKITIGTPEDDALRRDLTINALFYNLNTKQVEDFTKRGIEDLKNGIIRTPIDPRKTFEDDPLRILRIIRFTSKLGFVIAQDIIDCLKDQNLLERLRTKVGKERIKGELCSMLSHRSAFQSIIYFHQFELLPHMIQIFPNVKELPDFASIKRHFHLSYLLCEICHKYLEQPGGIIKNLYCLSQIYPDMEKEKSQLRYYTYISMIMQSFGDYQIETKPKKFENLVYYLMKDSLKATNKDIEIITAVTTSRAKFSMLVNQRETSKTIIRDTAKLIKEMGCPHGPIWELGFNTALVYDIATCNDRSIIPYILNNYALYLELIFKYKIQASYELKTFIDGKDVIKLFNQNGPVIKKILDNVFYWQIENGDASKDDLLRIIEQNPSQFLQ